jgi:hypothetical protein
MCRSEYKYTGTFKVDGTTLTIDFTAGTIRRTECDDAAKNKDPAVDDTMQNLDDTAMGLTGMFTVSSTELELNDGKFTYTH